MPGRKLKGVERDRAVLRGVALHIIQTVFNQPPADLKGTRRDWLTPPPLSAFTRLEPLGFGMPTEDWWVFNPADCTPAVVWPLNVGVIAEKAGEEGVLALSRTNTITSKQARGHATRFGPYMVRVDYAQMSMGKLVTAAGIMVWSGGKWADAQNHTQMNGLPDRTYSARDQNQPMIATAIALRQRYEWAVALGIENSPTVRFATDPTGMKEIFRIRDIPEGRDRRDALMTWVTDHWRQDRFDPDMETYVRRHLRGAVAFTWRGMQCELIPAQFDIDMRDKMLVERAAMRMAGEDKRPTITG